MSCKFDNIIDINDSKETWCLDVHILDLWSVVNSRGIKHIEMIVMDAKGGRIQVLIRSDHTEKWKQLLKEYTTCIINNDIICVVHEINNYQSKSSGKKIVVSLRLRDLGLPNSQKNEKPTQSTQTLSNWSGGTQFTSIERYKVEIYVRYGDATYCFVLWDNDCANIIAKRLKRCISQCQRVKVQPNFSQASVHKLDTDESFYTRITNDYINCEHSMYACGENGHDFNSYLIPIKVNSSISRDVDLDCDIVGATQYSEAKPPKKVKIEPNS
ncbi:hypothetical protein KIW84_075067 [Lathyrus oleraceus]|uniref:Replication protein A 70 kDa DNA-binding subunit B/D first OB fold domain-containing protein n=1 Tax=Pisum sativum TaxID=3888 RepID=A0A9D4ZYY4_PEA|nr:hypothetical protein KIW84_075067 [Pisum sativum]